MKAMKAMKAMKKKSVSKIARGQYAKVLVLRGSKEKIVGGMTAKDLTKNKHGRVVSKKRSAFGKKSPWIQAVAKARKALKSLDPGSELTVICTDPAAPNDFRAYCQASGHVLLSIENDDDGYRIRLRRAS